ncbi:MAG: HlyD family efflux transporter periplasmic adaptor subunit [Clostridiales bacterium]|jgi:multidrug efflux pump subunit AcrA (membrane-fusion protein)|nr:HlyD family efflux transporter periplasmic adaptor subunit [Clostridiales bacterium]
MHKTNEKTEPQIEAGAKTRTSARKKERKFKKKHIKWVVLGAIVITTAILVITCTNRVKAAMASVSSMTDVTVLSYASLENSISATGTVESDKKTHVYSTNNYTVQSIEVQVGDVVTMDDVLLRLDTESIEKQIREKEIAMDTSQNAGELSVKAARDAYYNYKEGLENGENPSIISAENAVRNALDAYDAAVKAYNEYVEDMRLGQVASVVSAEKAYTAASNAVYTAQAQLTTAQADLAADTANTTLQAQVAAAQAALQNAEDSLASAEAAYNQAYRAAKNAKDEYFKRIDTTQAAYESAVKSLEAAQGGADDQLEAYKNSYRSAQVSSGQDLAEYQLEEMRQDLADATVKAPVSGVVTGVFATVGATGSGLLFVIEDTANLIVKTTVKEYDIGEVFENMPVAIRADATGDETYEGRLSLIAPTAKKNAQGDTDTSGDVQFEAEVAVTSPDTRLRIGMSVRMDLIVAREDRVLPVPFDAIYKNLAGANCVLAAVDAGNMQYILEEREVVCGLENDLDIAISGDGIEPGLRVINNPGNYAAGQTITLYDAPNLSNSSGDFPTFFGPGVRGG